MDEEYHPDEIVGRKNYYMAGEISLWWTRPDNGTEYLIQKTVFYNADERKYIMNAWKKKYHSKIINKDCLFKLTIINHLSNGEIKRPSNYETNRFRRY